jgi:hypothetical protein
MDSVRESVVDCPGICTRRLNCSSRLLQPEIFSGSSVGLGNRMTYSIEEDFSVVDFACPVYG